MLDLVTGTGAWSDQRRDFERTIHRGFLGAASYWVVLEDLPLPDPLRTFAVLAPVVAAYSY